MRFLRAWRCSIIRVARQAAHRGRRCRFPRRRVHLLIRGTSLWRALCHALGRGTAPLSAGHLDAWAFRSLPRGQRSGHGDSRDETPRVERVSIDEAFIDITPGRFAPEDPLLVARRISDRVAALGVTCSIGVGCNKTVAKIASERDKPFGLTIVRPGTEQRFLAALPVSAMSGIGRSAEERLRRMRIYTLGELSRAPKSTLASIFGINGERMRSVRWDSNSPKSRASMKSARSSRSAMNAPLRKI